MAVATARLWWLRRHGYVRQLPTVTGTKRQDRLNWQIRFAEDAMTGPQRTKFVDLLGAEAVRLLDDTSWRKSWAAQLTDLTLGSDGFLTFRDNLDYAAAGGVTTAVEPGGSIRTTESPRRRRRTRRPAPQHCATALSPLTGDSQADPAPDADLAEGS